MLLLGYDIGSSSIKAALVEAGAGQAIGVVQHPETEMEIIARQPGWAEQHPEVWWDNLCLATKKLLQQHRVDVAEIKGIGIAYQMHGLVLVDKEHQVLRPSIIWCDSRAVEIGNQAFEAIGSKQCLTHLLNSPGNFTASKLKWVKDNEPQVYERIHKAMLPGDYIAMKLTGEIRTTTSGLSEGILWDFQKDELAKLVLEHYQIDSNLFPPAVPSFSFQGKLSEEAARATGLKAGTAVGYRAGDQPNNALSLNVFRPGEVAATGGTSGVVYGIVDEPVYDPLSRVNGFAHVNHEKDKPRIGILLCINGAGIQYGWVKNQMALEGAHYNDMERIAASTPIGADGLRIIPFGNGAERMLGNLNPGGQANNLQFNRHSRAHFYRASLEGIAFAFAYGIGILKEMGLGLDIIRVGNDNLFQSRIFSTTISSLVDSHIEVISTTGAIGAAKAAGVAIGAYASIEEAMGNNEVVLTYEPASDNGAYGQAYQAWLGDLKKLIQ
ncbi:MAG: carbohydrate kinase [Phaeodactylibacter sp.]|nr:carbohydrate kinase [Phaeodactylibacter sp.]MCB9303691.1 carbohydrate kinase [Lewinellaceae bacterium]